MASWPSPAPRRMCSTAPAARPRSATPGRWAPSTSCWPWSTSRTAPQPASCSNSTPTLRISAWRCHPRSRMDGTTATRPSRGEILELTVDSLAFGGAGVARLNGYVVFVADGMPGDRVRAEVQKSKRAYAEARAIEVVEPGPDRIEPRATHPGAPWQVLPYERQLEVKHAQVD